MLKEYYSIRYIRVTDIVCGRTCQGTFIYCYKIVHGIDNTEYMDFLDRNILSSVQSIYKSAQLCEEEMIEDTKWHKWFKFFAQHHVCMTLFPTFSSADLQTMAYSDVPKPKFPTPEIGLYIPTPLYIEEPGFPFNRVEFRYPLGIAKEDVQFSKGLETFCRENVKSFLKAAPILVFQNRYGHYTFHRFYKTFSLRACLLWPELMRLSIDVYDNHHLKQFMTEPNAFYNADMLKDTPYLSFCYRKTAYGTYERDIIENSYLCTNLNLTVEERYALIAHELGHFVEYSKQTIFADRLQEESTCDRYAVELGLDVHLKSALQKLLDSNVCDEGQNQILRDRIKLL